MRDRCGEAQRGSSVVVIGSYLVALVMEVDRLPRAGETLIGRNFLQTDGGKGSNMAVQAARLGASTQFVGCVGDDDYGRSFEQLLEREGVGAAHLKRRREAPTGAGFIVLGSAGENLITIDIGANALFSPADVDEAANIMRPPSVVLTQLEIPLPTALHAMKRGAEQGCTTILNPAPAHDLRGHDLAAVSFLTPNETEARVCLGLQPDEPGDERELGERLLRLGCGCVVITQGERGCLVVRPEGAVQIPAFPVAAVVDTTGAGDSFNASLAVALSEGMPLEEAVRFANAAAGLSCTQLDTVPSFPARERVEAVIDRQ